MHTLSVLSPQLEKKKVVAEFIDKNIQINQRRDQEQEMLRNKYKQEVILFIILSL